MLQSNNYLVIRLYGCMASWGEIAVGESRHSATHPSKSALLGLIAAALGIDREQEEMHKALASHYHFAVKQLNVGHIMRDFHTTQVPDSVGKFVYRTRRDEVVIGHDRLGNNLSSRDYRTDSVNLIAIKALPNAPFDLEIIAEHLRKPVYHLYLGRKSCPLAAPLSPQCISATAGYAEAFTKYNNQAVLPLNADSYWLDEDKDNRYYWEGEIEDFGVIDRDLVSTLTRLDQPRSRKRWQFSQRLEHFYQPRSVD